MDNTRSGKVSTALQYLFFSRSFLSNYKIHIALIKLLRSFSKRGLIDKNYTSQLYSKLFRNYLSLSLSIENKLKIFYHHYSFLQERIEPEYLKQIYNNGIVLFTEINGDDHYSIKLIMSKQVEFEGLLSLQFDCNGYELAVIGFTIAPGEIFGLKEQYTGYVTRIQKNGTQKARGYEATKYFKDIFLTSILIKSLEAVFVAFNITNFAGVTATQQISLYLCEYGDAFFTFYDQVWIDNGGVLNNENYIVSLPLLQKPILLVKQTHRNRTLRKRNKLKEIYDQCLKIALQLKYKID